MTPRERWLAAIHRQRADRIPVDFWGTPEVVQSLLAEIQCETEDELWRALKIDRAHAIAPRYIGPKIPEGIWRFGTKRQEVADGKGVYHEVTVSPLAGMRNPRELENFPWPSPDWFDYSTLKEDLASLEEWPVCAGCFEPFNLYCALRGLEQAFEDIAANPDFLEAALQRIFDFHYELNRRMFEAASGAERGILYTYVAEDLGSQHGLLMSLSSIHRFFLPRKAMIDLAHEHGILAFHHDDGACRKVLPDMLDIGIDILNPIQWRCPGMAREELKKEFGQRLTFHGGVDNQFTLPFGSPAQVREEVLENIRILGHGGGYILAPCHNIQPATPVENILAMYAAVDDA